jgi:hypothetical protein
MKSITHTINPVCSYCRSYFFSLLLALCIGTYAKVLPVVSDCNIIAGARGVAIALTADAPFSATFSARGKTVQIALSECVYALPEFSYADFPSASPVRSITAKETASGNTSLEILLKQAVSMPVRAVQKGNQWMALLSDQPVTEYAWKASSTATVVKTPPPEVTPPEPAPQVRSQSEESPVTTGALRNIRLLQRGQICELAFEFDAEVASSIRKNGTSITFSVENISNQTGSKLLQLPPNSVFKKVSVSEVSSGTTPLLKAAITIDTALAESNFNVAFTRGTVLSFFLMQRKQQKATLWTSGHGLAWNYQFYNVPSYDVDLESIGSKARRDARQQLSREKTFAIRESKKPDTRQDNKMVQSDESITSDPIDPSPPAVAVSPPAEDTTATIVVTADRANIRGVPSLNGRVRGKLTMGDTVYVVGSSEKWYKINSQKATGYIFSSLVRSIDMAVAAPTTIAAIEPAKAAVAPEPPPVITPVSTPITNDVYLTSHTTPASSDQIQTADTMAQVKSSKGIRYRGGGRDPFAPIIPSSVSAKGLPFPEHLRLVGVLFDDADRIALCEDIQNDNKPYALREHDPVEKGKILKIYQDKVVFLITEFGISRSFTLQLSKVSDEQKASTK